MTHNGKDANTATTRPKFDVGEIADVLPHESRLTLPVEMMRSLGYHVVDMVIDHFESVGADPVMRRASPSDLAHILEDHLPGEAADPMRVLEEVAQLLRHGIAHLDHPLCLAWVPSPNNYMSVLAATLAAGFNAPSSAWVVGPATTAIELTTIRWLVELLGLPTGTGGLFVSGGSTANLLALAVARDTIAGPDLYNAVAYYSDQTHASVPQALRVLGVREEHMRSLPTDAEFRLDPVSAAERIEDDRREGLHPFALIANAGTTNTGAVDPLPELAVLCRAQRLWLHIDGAYGAAAAITDQGRHTLIGLESADSLTIDPHKWLFQAPELGCVLLRQPDLLRQSFSTPRQPFSAATDDGSVSLSQYGIQQTREFRALKLWLSLKVFGSHAFTTAVGRGIQLAEHIGRFISDCPGLELVTPPSLGVLTFRCTPASRRDSTTPDSLVDRISSTLLESGEALVMPTVVANRRVLRLCTINPRTSISELEKVVIDIRDMGSGARSMP